MTPRRGTVCLALAGIVMLATACGSTIEAKGRATIGGSAGDSTGLSSTGAATGGSASSGVGTGAAAGTSAGAGTTGGGAVPGGTGAGIGTGSGSGAGSGTGAATTGTPGQGPKSPVKVGIEYIDAAGGAAAASAIGVSGVSAGDQRDAYQILVNRINARGGLAGHKIEPVYVSYDPTGSDLETQEQAMCARFTQDNKVFAALIISISGPTLRNCLRQAGVVTIGGGTGSTADASVFAAYPTYVTSGSVSLDRLGHVYVDGLARGGYFSGNPRIGLVTTDDPPYVRTANGPIRQALRRHGLTVAEEVKAPPAYTIGELGPNTAAIQNAVLRFKTRNVTHVMFLAPTGGAAFAFAQAAEGQDYHPRYGVTTNDELFKLQSQTPASQLRRAVGVGWFALYDVASADTTISPGGKSCLAYLKAAGNTPGDQNATAHLLSICDQTGLLAAGVRAGGPQLGTAAFIHGVEALGTSLPTAAYPLLRYGPGRHDGVGAVRNLSYVDTCSCFRYRGAPVRI